METLTRAGDQIVTFELQGQLFFGTADQLYTELEPYLKSSRFIILNMKRVQSIDYTAANMLRQIYVRIQAAGGYLILCSVRRQVSSGMNVLDYLNTLGFTDTGQNFRYFPELDFALEWSEDELLDDDKGRSGLKDKVLDLSEIELFSGMSDEAVSRFSGCVRQIQFSPGETVFKRGDKGREIYFIRQGLVKIILPIDDKSAHHLATFGKGVFFGEMSFLDADERSANAVAAEETSLFSLSREDFKSIESEYPQISGIFFERLAYVIAYRLRQNHLEIISLEEG
jgi:SulP family sulfate permease